MTVSIQNCKHKPDQVTPPAAFGTVPRGQTKLVLKQAASSHFQRARDELAGNRIRTGGTPRRRWRDDPRNSGHPSTRKAPHTHTHICKQRVGHCGADQVTESRQVGGKYRVILNFDRQANPNFHFRRKNGTNPNCRISPSHSNTLRLLLLHPRITTKNNQVLSNTG